MLAQTPSAWRDDANRAAWAIPLSPPPHAAAQLLGMLFQRERGWSTAIAVTLPLPESRLRVVDAVFNRRLTPDGWRPFYRPSQFERLRVCRDLGDLITYALTSGNGNRSHLEPKLLTPLLWGIVDVLSRVDPQRADTERVLLALRLPDGARAAAC